MMESIAYRIWDIENQKPIGVSHYSTSDYCVLLCKQDGQAKTLKLQIQFQRNFAFDMKF